MVLRVVIVLSECVDGDSVVSFLHIKHVVKHVFMYVQLIVKLVCAWRRRVL